MITRVKIVHKDEEGNIQGGVEFFHTPGNNIILYQEWEHTAARDIYGPVNPDAIGKLGLLEYLLDGWLGQREDHFYVIHGESITQNFR